MGYQLTERVIKLLCGKTSYDRGGVLYRDGHVKMLKQDPDTRKYEAEVTDQESGIAYAEIDSNGDVFTECSCIDYGFSRKRCRHIAALLLNIRDIEQTVEAPMRPYPSLLHPSGSGNTEDGQLTPRYSPGHDRSSDEGEQDALLSSQLLGLFSYSEGRRATATSRFDTREVLEMEFIFKLYPYGNRKYLFGVELRIGKKRLYIVQRIREFLACVKHGKTCMFTKNFTYDPELHSFKKEDDDILQELIRVYEHESMFKQSLDMYAPHGKHGSGDRMLIIPPTFWPQVRERLSHSNHSLLSLDGILTDKLEFVQDPIPLQFEFDEAGDDQYLMKIEGLERMIVLESYGLVIVDGKLIQLELDACRRLSEMKQLLENANKPHIRIQPEMMESIMERVVPGLMKLGSVHVAQTVSDRIVKTPLKAKLYLDRVRGRLLAGLEFQYGEITINPLEGHRAIRSSSSILVRDGKQEQRILELMENASFAKTDGGFFMNDEDAEYDFLYHTIPQLEKLLVVYATTAVKERVLTEPMGAKVRVEVDERTDWLELKFDMEGIREAEIREIVKSLEEKRKYHRLRNGALLPLESAEFQAMVALMNRVGPWLYEGEGTQFKMPAVQGLQLLDWEDSGSTVQLGRSLRQMLQHVKNPDHLDFAVPPSLETVLRDYQKFGFQWMKTMAHYRFGGILADDMGLGKTIQSIAFILSVLPEIRERNEPALIVAPASLLYNWHNELLKFAPEIKAVIADGTQTERAKIIQNAGNADVIITSYPLLRRDVERYAKLPFLTLILDEAQFFKNYATQTAQVVKTLHARYRFALTGTPVENRLEELWSIYDAVFPALFGDRKTFQELPKETVMRRVRPFLLRRLKSDVLKELPEKIETVQASGLLIEQKKLYTAYLAKLRQETLKHLAQDGFQKSRIRILAGITRLRQICCHPALFVEGYEGSSAKFEQLLETIEECRLAGRRMLVFSQFTGMLNLIAGELGYRGIPFFYLDGQTPASERVKLCERFNEGEREVFLISLKAGGTGLNLTGADTVILYDLWWNPAVEQQATDRAHRIGQKKVVQVIRLVAQDTIEDKMVALQQKKKDLIEELVQPGEESLPSWTEAEIRELLTLQG
ncbi:DEAD/DEAH box helicase [Paenibacillus sp. EZ-K15]|uniref:DEAD/DEAH box helicase n=1 Tax=Paenibacillus sp. EZ-K15 TaxID=2044275 RepID=UPI000BF42BD6|nr:DEAD/DEAH box helicase [Paenibacillus sp. EZ-K15]